MVSTPTMVQMRKNRMSKRPKCFCSFCRSTSATVSSARVLVIQTLLAVIKKATSSPAAISSLIPIYDIAGRVAQVGTRENRYLSRLGPLGAGMSLAVAGLEALDGHVGVDLGGRGRGMAENLLDAAQVSAALEQVGGRAVAQAVRARVAGRPALAQALVDDPASGPRLQAAAARAEKQSRPAGRGGKRGPALVEPGADRAQGRHPDRDGAFLVALAPDADGPAGVVEAVRGQPAQLADPDAGRVEEFEHRGVAQGDGLVGRRRSGLGGAVGGVKDGAHLVLAQDVGQGPAGLQGAELRAGVGSQPAAAVRAGGLPASPRVPGRRLGARAPAANSRRLGRPGPCAETGSVRPAGGARRRPGPRSSRAAAGFLAPRLASPLSYWLPYRRAGRLSYRLSPRRSWGQCAPLTGARAATGQVTRRSRLISYRDTPIELKFDMGWAVRQGDPCVHPRAVLRDGPRNALEVAPREGSSMGQKTVRFSDLSGQLITHDDALARIVVHEHPELVDGPVEIEALTDEAATIEHSALRLAVIDLYLPDDLEPRRIILEADAFDKLATENPMNQLLIAARPIRRGPRASVSNGSRGDRLDYATLEHAGNLFINNAAATEKQLVRDHLDEINQRLAGEGLRTISVADPDHVERYGLQDRTAELDFDLEEERAVAAG